MTGGHERGRRTRTFGVATLFVVVLVGATSLGAQPPPSDSALAEAKRQFKLGSEHYKVGHFDEALVAYEKAYQAKPLPAFLFNIGQCHFNLGRHERAVFFYESYLREVPDAGNQDLVEELIGQANAELEKTRQAKLALLEKQTAEEAARAAEAERERQEEERLKAEANRRRAEADAVAAQARAEEAQTPNWWLWGAGAGAAAVGVAFVVLAGAVTAGTLFVLLQPPQTPMGSAGTVDWRTSGFVPVVVFWGWGASSLAGPAAPERP